MTTSEILYRDADTSEYFWSRSRPGTGDILVLIKYRDFQSRAAHPAYSCHADCMFLYSIRCTPEYSCREKAGGSPADLSKI